MTAIWDPDHVPIVQSGSTSIGYTDTGSGDAVVLVHGFLFDRTMWRRQHAVLADAGWRCISVDLRGFGESGVQPGEVPLSTHAADLAAVLTQLDVGTAVLLGYSMGGQVVMEFADRWPDRVRAVVFSDTFAGLDTPEAVAGRLALADRLEREGVDAYAEEFLPLVLSPRSVAEQREVADHARAMMRGTDSRGAAAALRGRAHRRDYERVVAALPVPALVLAGAQDSFDRGVLATSLAAAIPDARLVTIDPAGHTPSMENPDAFDAALLEFLTAIAARQTG